MRLYYARASIHICRDTGHKNVKEVVSVIFAYLALLRQPGGVSREIFEESRQIALMRFNFRDKAEPSSIAQMLAGSMQTHDDKCAPKCLHAHGEMLMTRLISALMSHLLCPFKAKISTS